MEYHVDPVLVAQFGYVLAGLRRSDIEALVEAGIERLDALDGDIEREDDLEDCCSAGDDSSSGGRTTARLLNDALPGDPDDADGHNILGTLPVYGVDQLIGPINEEEAVAAHIAAGRRH